MANPRRHPAHGPDGRAAAALAEQIRRAITAELDLIDNTTDPAIRAAITRIRTILTDGPPPAPCPATTPHTDGGPPLTCSLTTPHTLHFDEQRSVRWLPDADTVEGAR